MKHTTPISMIALIVVIALLSAVFLSSCEDVETSDRVDSLIEDIDAPVKDSVEVPSIQEEAPLKEGCGDGVCQPEETKCTCPDDCGTCKGEVSNITEFRCEDGKCKILTKGRICGNGVCDAGEFSSCPGDCPVCEPDQDICTKDYFDDKTKACLHDPIIPCCSNKVCEPPGEQHSCIIDCKDSDVSFKDYPSPFIKDSKINTLVIVGSKGAGASITASIDIIRGWTYYNKSYSGANPGYDGKAKLDTEIDSIQGKNAIIIGGACENKFTDQLMKPYKDCNEGLSDNIGLLRLYQTGPDTYAIVVAGKTGEDVRAAAKILERYKEKEIKGYQVEVIRP